MPFNALLLPLVGGFLFISFWNRTKYGASRSDGQRLLLESALWGIALLACSYFTVRLILIVWPPALAFWRALVPLPGLGIPAFSLLFGVTLPFLLNFFWTEEHENARSYRAFSDYLGILFFQAQRRARPVMITLRNGKVYIGIVHGCNTPGMHDRNGSVYLQPAISGYRKGETHEVCLTTDYTAALEAIVNECDNPKDETLPLWQREPCRSSDDPASSPVRTSPADLLDSMKIAISMSDIVTATIFSKELYPCFDSSVKLAN